MIVASYDDEHYIRLNYAYFSGQHAKRIYFSKTPPCVSTMHHRLILISWFHHARFYDADVSFE